MQTFNIKTQSTSLEPSDQYTDQQPEIFCPFEIAIDPMERLLLINFEKDPDELYIGFEPQVFHNSIKRVGLLIIGWRKDGKVDVYHQPSVNPDAQKYDIAGKGLSNMIEREMPNSYFDVRENGVDAFIDFTDILGRHIFIKIKEAHPKKRKPFGLLAPMGDAAESPSAMPLVFLHDFYFVRVKHTEIIIKIDGNVHIPDKLPLLLDGTKMYFTRYSLDPLIITLNPACNDYLIPIHLENGEATVGETKFNLEEKGKTISIKSLVRRHKKHNIQISFEPAFPNLTTLAANSTIKGEFIIQSHNTTGKIKGMYELHNKADNIEIVMIPSGGWIPNETKLSLRFLYFVAKIFKHWPKTYKWTASIKKDENNDQFVMKSGWKRIRF